MGQQERVSRRSVVDYAKAAVDHANTATAKAAECVAAVNNQAKRLDASDRRFSEHEQENNRRFTAQGGMIADLEKRQVEILRLLEAHQQMGFFARLRWLVTGHTPSVTPTSAGYYPPL